MARGGKRPGAGRPKLSKAEKERRALNKAYETYSFRYEHDTKNRYGRSSKLTFNEFKRSYEDKVEEGAAHPIQAILKEQRLFTKKQSSTWAKHLNQHLKEWKETGAPNEDLQKITDILKGRRLYVDDFYNIWDKRIDEVIAIMNKFDLWEEAVGS